MAVNAAVNRVLFMVDDTDAQNPLLKLDTEVLFFGTNVPGGSLASTFRVNVLPDDSIAVLGNKMRAAVDAEAARVGLSVPVNMLSMTFSKLR